MRKGWKIAAVGFIILLLFLIFFKEHLYQFIEQEMDRFMGPDCWGTRSAMINMPIYKLRYWA